MAKVIDSNHIWYQEVAPRSFYREEDLERAIILNLELIFPEFKALTFKKTLRDLRRNKSNRADLAMVKRDYTEWYVIEVELGAHNIVEVEDQIATFYNCAYEDEHADYIFEKRPDIFDKDELRNMIHVHVPKLMVIVNEPKPEWKVNLGPYDCKICIFQVYHDFKGKALYRLNGEHPNIYTGFCHCKYLKDLPHTIRLLEDGFLDQHGISEGDVIEIEFNGIAYTWERADAGGEIYLVSSSTRAPLDPLSDRYRLNVSSDRQSFSFTKD